MKYVIIFIIFCSSLNAAYYNRGSAGSYTSIKVDTSENSTIIVDKIAKDYQIKANIQTQIPLTINIASDFVCPAPLKSGFINLVSNYFPSENQIECTLYKVESSRKFEDTNTIREELLQVFRYRLPADFSSFEGDRLEALKEMKYYNNISIANSIDLDNIQKELATNVRANNQNNLSSYLVDILSLNKENIDLEKSSQYSKVVTYNNDDESTLNQLLITSRIGALFSFLQDLKHIYSNVGTTLFIASLISLFGGVFFFYIKLKKEGNDSENDLKPTRYIIYIFITMILFSPFPISKINDDKTMDSTIIYTNLANTVVSSLYSTITYVNNNLSYYIMKSIITNQLKNSGIQTGVQTFKLIKTRNNLVKEIELNSIINKQCSNMYTYFDKMTISDSFNQKSVANHSNHKFNYGANMPLGWVGTFNSNVTTYSFSLPACLKNRNIWINNKKEVELIKEQLRYADDATTQEIKITSDIIKSIYRGILEDGFLSMPFAYLKIQLLSQHIEPDKRSKSNAKRIEKELKKYDDDNLLNYIARKIPLLLLPGSSTVLQVTKDTISFPILSSGLGLAAAITYSEAFLKQLDTFIIVAFMSIYFFLWLALLLLYVLLSYFLLPVCFMPNNHRIIGTYFKTIFIHSYKSTLILLSSLVAFIMSDLIKQFSNITIRKTILESQSMLNLGTLSSMSLAVLEGVLIVVMSLASIFLIYTLISKASEFVMQAVGSTFKDSTSDMLQDVAQKTRQKGV
ncbi:MAG: hypothetical protein KAQ94_02740 [Arcobacteraceae bacterium]|nr:hypothetical protein [Arcobacteraceae bacterium]